MLRSTLGDTIIADDPSIAQSLLTSTKILVREQQPISDNIHTSTEEPIDEHAFYFHHPKSRTGGGIQEVLVTRLVRTSIYIEQHLWQRIDR